MHKFLSFMLCRRSWCKHPDTNNCSDPAMIEQQRNAQGLWLRHEQNQLWASTSLTPEATGPSSHTWQLLYNVTLAEHKWCLTYEHASKGAKCRLNGDWVCFPNGNEWHLVGDRSKSEGRPACLSGEASGEEEVEGMPSSSDLSSWLYAPLPSANSLQNRNSRHTLMVCLL